MMLISVSMKSNLGKKKSNKCHNLSFPVLDGIGCTERVKR